MNCQITLQSKAFILLRVTNQNGISSKELLKLNIFGSVENLKYQG